MDKNRDLLPWVLGGLSIAAVAIGLAVVSTNSGASLVLRMHGHTTAGALPAIVPVPSIAPAHASAPAMQTAQTAQTAQTVTVPPTEFPQMQIATPAMEPSDKVWECTINGQKSFSDTPCGGKSIVREIGPINRMDSAPILPRTRSYEPEPSYQPDDTYPSAADGEQAGDSEQQLTDNSYPAYPVYIAVPSRGHRRPNHAHRPHNHDHGPRVQSK